MADLDVQPKHKSPIWIWIVLLIVVIGAAFLLMRGCNKSYSPTALATTDSTTTDTILQANSKVATTQPDWESVDFSLPKSTYDEVTDTSIVVRGNDKYTIYGLGENVLFAPDKSVLQGSAEGRLQMVASSLQKRFKNAALGVYGHADSTGNAEDNKTLSGERANAVKDWLINKAGFAPDMISVHSLGADKPLASNATAKGRQQNRSVEIVAFPQDTTAH